MKPSEVRVGNTILMLNDKGEWQDIAVSVSHLAVMSEFEDKFKPKPVSKEWLFKVGFEQTPRYKKLNSYSKPLDVFDLALDIINQGNDSELIAIIAKDPDEPEYIGPLMTALDMPCAAIHHIQNIYYFAKGEEIE